MSSQVKGSQRPLTAHPESHQKDMPKKQSHPVTVLDSNQCPRAECQFISLSGHMHLWGMYRGHRTKAARRQGRAAGQAEDRWGSRQGGQLGDGQLLTVLSFLSPWFQSDSLKGRSPREDSLVTRIPYTYTHTHNTQHTRSIVLAPPGPGSKNNRYQASFSFISKLFRMILYMS